jgi:flagellar biosynthesis protein FlhB
MNDASEKTLDATPAKRDRARREGNSARSAEIAGVAAFAAATLAAYAAAPMIAAAAYAGLRDASTSAQLPLAQLVPLAIAACLPLAAAAGAGAFLGLVQSGGLHVVALKLDVGKLAPGAGLKRMFGGEAVVGAARGALAFGAALAALVPVGRDLVASATTLASPAAAAHAVAVGSLRAIGVALAVGALFAGADYALARRRWLRGLRMSQNEMRRESRENDGDPQIKQRRSRLHRALVRGTIGRTREASFIIVNPTHIAIAVRYAPPDVPVPHVLVRAADDAAAHVREIARACGIPIVENVALARQLYASAEAGREIPTETFVAVAQVIAALVRAGLLA